MSIHKIYKTSLLILRFIVNSILAVSALVIVLALALPIGFYGMALYIEPTLPSVNEIKKQQLQMPLQIYSADNKLIGQYGKNMSLPIAYEEIPVEMINSFLAAEDAFFFEHSGISVKGLGRAITQLLTDDPSQTGGSTITMQVAKNFFLTPEQTLKRKLTELFLARKIEQHFNKDEILTLYVNHIYLGEGAYGIKAAAKKYYSKSLENLTIAETAMLAGLPKAPSAYNPVVNPERALERRNWILKRMSVLGHISESDYKEAVDSPIGLNIYEEEVDNNEMMYLAEMARISLVNQFGNQVMHSGWRVKITVDSQVQLKANQIVRKHLDRYDQRHGWRGAEANGVPLTNFYSFLGTHPAKVVKVNKRSFEAILKSGETIRVPWSGMNWARKYYSANRVGGHFGSASKIVKIDDVIRVKKKDKSWKLIQIPKVQGSLVSINPDNGSIISLVGGYHFLYSYFNRATSAWRQPGSIIKPLIYSAALEKGYRPNSLISDAPLKIGNWRPKNSDGRYYGLMELRKALYLSRNLVSIRLLQSVGLANARNLLDQFGLDKEKLPATLSLALGTGKASPLQMATAYATFANGGHRIQPYIIEKIYDFDSKLLYQTNPKLACASCFNEKLEKLNESQRAKAEKVLESIESEKRKSNSYDDMSIEELEEKLRAESTGEVKTGEIKEEKPEHNDKSTDSDAQSDRLKDYPVEFKRAEQAPRILSPSVAYEMAGILKDVIDRGTAKKAQSLGRSDIGGKTGTTNNFRDAWFAGFHPSNSTVVWVGFDQPSTLGYRQYGGKVALPVWIDYMKFSLKDVPNQWVTLENGAQSKKTKQRTIEIDKDGKKTDIANKESKKNNDKKQADSKKVEAVQEVDTNEADQPDDIKDLPTGTPAKRKVPFVPKQTNPAHINEKMETTNQLNKFNQNLGGSQNTGISQNLPRDSEKNRVFTPVIKSSDPQYKKPVQPHKSEEKPKEQLLETAEVDSLPPIN